MRWPFARARAHFGASRGNRRPSRWSTFTTGRWADDRSRISEFQFQTRPWSSRRLRVQRENWMTCNRTRLLHAVGLVLLVTGATTLADVPVPWVSGYYVGYMAAFYPPEAIDFTSLTHVMVFAVLPQRDATLDTRLFIDPANGPKTAQEVSRRAHAAAKKAILTIGGSDSAPAFRAAVRSNGLFV